jgi:signal transduction histidine kinase
VGSLSASIAHEFNNPLQGVMAILKGLSQYAALAEEEQEMVSLALQECRRMKDLIAGLRDFHRPTSGKLEPVDLHAVFDALLLITKKELLSRRISIVKKYADNLPTVIGVADQLKQVLMNLLKNASYACERGGTITLSTAITEDGVVVHIEDTGTGIRQKNLGRIFEPFFTTKPETIGTGLGLSVSYGIIKNHGGCIEVKSEVDKGSVFSVFLPLSPTL